MVSRFGTAYRDYMQQVPMFFPHRGNWGRLFDALRM